MKATCVTARSPSGARMEALIGRLGDPRIDVSAIVRFATWQELAAARDNPAAFGAGEDAQAIEGVMLKRRDGPYLPGRPKGPWWKWKRGPILIDAVLMYAQRGHGKHSSFYSDYTFGVWRGGPDGGELVPVGKAYFGFTDEGASSDRPFRAPEHDQSLWTGARGGAPAGPGPCTRSCIRRTATLPRHKSGLAMRFPRINRLRWDKLPAESDRLETLERMLVAARQSR